MFNGDRVKQVREIKGWTQKELASRIGVKQTTISQVESGVLQASDEIIQRIVLQSGFPLSFFKQSNTTDFPLGSLLYRARSSMTLRTRSRARQYARAIFEVIRRMESDISIMESHIPRLEDSPVTCAVQARSSLGLSPDTPIDNLIHMLEKNGVIILALPIELEKMDAFSAWVGNDKRRPVIVLSKNTKYGDRLRFNLAHEIGHLIMHQAMTGNIRQIDREADMFAGEFLAPKEGIEKEITKPVTLSKLIPLKVRWKISLQALIRRSFDLGIINKNQYKYLMVQISKKGKTNEPINIPVEKPRLLGQMAEMKYGVPIDYKILANDVNLPPHLIKETLEVHAIKAQLSDLNNNGKIVQFTQSS
jgi:Zn-dependent peptidase ImmA (M78 family)/DNA-binding XRE family transcriptional regulator